MAKTLTAANSVITLTILSLAPVPTQLQGYAADDVFDVEGIDNAEIAEGVDGILSVGWVYRAVKMGITLQADSDSTVYFENWAAAEGAVKEKYEASGSIYLPSVQRKYDLDRVFLMNYSPTPSAKKILQPRKFNLVIGTMTPAAI